MAESYASHLLDDALRILGTVRTRLDAAEQYARQAVDAADDGESGPAYTLACAACKLEEEAIGDCLAFAALRDRLAPEKESAA